MAATYVQSNATTGGGTSIAVAFSSAQTAGDQLVVFVGVNVASNPITGVTDTVGNAYTLCGSAINAGGGVAAIAYRCDSCKAAAAGANTVTAAFNSSQGNPEMFIGEYSGLGTYNAFESSTGTQSPAAVTFTLPASGQVMAYANSFGVTSAGTGYTQRVSDGFGDILEDNLSAPSGSNTASMNINSGAWALAVLTYTSSGGTVTVAPAGIEPGPMGFAALSVQVSTAGIESAAAVGQPLVAFGVMPGAIGSGEALGASSVAAVLSPAGSPSGGAVGAGAVSPVVSPSGVESVAATGASQVAVGVEPAGIGSGAASGASSLTPQLLPAGVGPTDTGAPALAVVVSPAGAPTGEALGAAIVAVVASPAGIEGAGALGPPTLAPVLLPAGIDSLGAVGPATVTPVAGGYLYPAGIEGGGQVGAATITPQVNPAGTPSAEASGAHVLAFGIFPAGIPSAGALGAPSAAPVVAPAGVDAGAQPGWPVVFPTVLPSGIPGGGSVGGGSLAPTVTMYAYPAGIESGAQVGAAQLVAVFPAPSDAQAISVSPTTPSSPTGPVLVVSYADALILVVKPR